MKKLLMLGIALALSCMGTGGATATDFYPWNNHAAPFTFLFDNEIDTHQQTRRTRDGSLFGFFYIQFTRVITKDRYRVAEHVDCNGADADCTVGWTLNGKPVKATFLYQAEHDHPVFLVNRQDIPQPGTHAHFHWLGDTMQIELGDGYLLQLTAVDKFCFIHHGAADATSSKTCRDNGGINVDPGIDIATHLNIVTSAPPDR
jgi:hypothetical protein